MAYVTLTVRNRLGFVRCVERAFISGLSSTELEENDLQALLELICPDFRQSLTKVEYFKSSIRNPQMII